MFGRFAFFILGAVTGGLVVIRAFGRRPTPSGLRDSAVRTSADALDLAAWMLRPNRNG
jgi:hypothetical protein